MGGAKEELKKTSALLQRRLHLGGKQNEGLKDPIKKRDSDEPS